MLNCDDGLVDTTLHYENQLEFATKEEAKKWVVEKGKEINCVIVSNGQSKPKRFELVCKRSGTYRSHQAKGKAYIKTSSRKIYKTHTKKCECPFKIVVHKTGDVWKMRVANGCHNHEDSESLVGQPADAKLEPQQSAQNCYDGLGAVGVRPNFFRRPPPTPSQQPSHFSSSGPFSYTTQMKSPSGHQDNWMMGWIGVDSQMQPLSSSMRSPTPASNQPVAVTQASVSPFQNQKINTNGSRCCEANTVSIDELEHFPCTEPDTMRVQSILLAWKSLIKDRKNDISVGIKDRKNDVLVTCITGLLKIFSAMETVRGVELTEELLDEWEGFIQDAESLEFNIKWLRERFNQFMDRWRSSSLATDKEIERQNTSTGCSVGET